MAKSKAQRETSAGGVVYRRSANGPEFLLILDGHGNWGFPKGHVEAGEMPLDAARREVGEETGVNDLVLRGELDVIDWYFRARKLLVHKHCHLFLFESFGAASRPQLDEGITACAWYPLEDALRSLAYENARLVLRRAGGMVGAMAPDEAVAGDR